MIVQFNTDHNIAGGESFRGPFIAMIAEELGRFADQITRVEAHLTDENGKKTGANDKRCVLEARLEGMQPIAATNHADTYQEAVEGALMKLKSLLDTRIGRLNHH